MANSDSHPVSTYTVGWLSALDKEYSAAMAMLDEEHDVPKDFRKNQSDANSYSWGRVGPHNVVLCSLPDKEYGTVSAGQTASALRASLPDIRLGLFVGIGAGIPGESVVRDVVSVERDIRVGDVIVGTPEGDSSGVVQYDLRKVMSLHGETVIQHIGSLDTAPRALRTAITKLKARRLIGRGGHQEFLESLLSNKEAQHTFYYPGLDKDPLNGAGGARTKAGRRERSEVHYGVIASGNTLFRDSGELASLLADYAERGIHPICAEMEAAGLMNNFPCLIIRGVSDYANERKNDDWHGFAAAAAAAYAKEVLLNLEAQAIQQETRIADIIINEVRETATGVREVKARFERDEVDQVLSWLCPNTVFQWQEMAVSASIGFLHETVFERWVGDARWHLNCHGDLGVGKTLRAQAVMEHLIERFADCDDTVVVGVCLEQSSVDVEPSAVSLLRRILRTVLALEQQTFPSDIMDAWKSARRHHSGRYWLTREQLRSQLTTQLAPFRRRFLIVDALERAEYYRRELLDELDWLRDQGVAIFTTELSRGYRVEIYCDECPASTSVDATNTMDTYWRCMGCKNYDLCQACYHHHANHCGQMILQHQPRRNLKMTAEAREVAAFVESTLEKNATAPGSGGEDERLYMDQESVLSIARRLLGNISWSAIAEHVQMVAPGSFRFASEFVKLLCEQNAPEHAMRLLREPHNGDLHTLKRLYASRLNDCLQNSAHSRADTAREWLARVVAAAHPLTLVELQHAVAVSTNDEARTREDLQNYMHRGSDVLLSANGMLAFDDYGENESPNVRFAHASLQRYVESVQQECFEDADERMLHSCISYLSLDIFSRPFTESSLLEEAIDLHPFAPYASLYWGLHAQRISERSHGELILEMLQDQDRLECVMQMAWRARSRSYIHDGWDVEGGVTPLHVCAFYGLSECLRALLADGEDAEACERVYHQTPLSYACRRGHVDIVRQLLEHGVNVHHVDRNGRTPLIEAIENHRDDVFNLLMEEEFGLDVDHRDPDLPAATALVIAARNNEVNKVRQLLRRARDVNVGDNDNRTAIFWSVRSLHVECVKVLLADRRIDLQIKEKLGGRTPLDLLADPLFSNPDYDPEKLQIARLLMQDRRRLTPSSQAITNAITTGQVELLKILTSRGLETTSQDKHGRSFLHHAASQGALEMVRIVYGLLQGTSWSGINALDNHGASVLHVACTDVIETRMASIEFLLECGADPSLRDDQGLTPCHHARRASRRIWRERMCPLLKDQISAELLDDVEGDTCLNLTPAIQCLDVEQFKTALDVSGDTLDPEINRYDGSHVLHLIANIVNETCCLEMLNGLLPRSRHFVNKTNDCGRTCLHLAVRPKIAMPCFQRLLRTEGIDLDIKDQWGMTPLELAQHGDPECYAKCVYLVAAGARLPAGPNIQPGILEKAIELGELPVVERLLLGGVTLRRRGSCGDNMTVIRQAEYVWRRERDRVRAELFGQVSGMRLSDLVDRDPRVSRKRRIVTVLSQAHEEARQKKMSPGGVLGSTSASTV